jgi:hypothetical protein
VLQIASECHHASVPVVELLRRSTNCAKGCSPRNASAVAGSSWCLAAAASRDRARASRRRNRTGQPTASNPGISARCGTEDRGTVVAPLARDRASGLRINAAPYDSHLAASAGFALATVVTLAIAIGATTAIFSVVDGVLLGPLPFPQSDRLVAVRHVIPSLDDDEHDASPAFYLTYRDNNTTFESVALWFSNTATVTGAGEPEEILAVRASVELLPTLRVEPLLGRRFTAADDTPGNPPTVMLSYGYWQRRFGGARDVVGRTLTLDGAPAEIVGVLPPEFRFLEEQADVLTPAQPDRARSFAGPIGERVIARLEDGATLVDASADVARMVPIAFDVSCARSGASNGREIRSCRVYGRSRPRRR